MQADTNRSEVLIGADIEAALQAFPHLLRLIDERLTTLTVRGLRNAETAGFDRIVVTIDEIAFFTAVADVEPPLRYIATTLLRDVLTRGSVVLVVPDSVNKVTSLDLVPSSLRDLLA